MFTDELRKNKAHFRRGAERVEASHLEMKSREGAHLRPLLYEHHHNCQQPVELETRATAFSQIVSSSGAPNVYSEVIIKSERLLHETNDVAVPAGWSMPRTASTVISAQPRLKRPVYYSRPIPVLVLSLRS